MVKQLLGTLLTCGALFIGTAPALAADTPCAVTIKLAGPPTQRASMGEAIAFEVENLSAAIDKCHLDPRKLILFLDGHALKGVSADVTDRAKNKVEFTLNRSSDSRAAWGRVIGSPTNLQAREVRVGIGTEENLEIPLVTPDKQPMLELVVFHDWWFWISSVILAAIFVLFIMFARSSNLVRDRVPGGEPGKIGPYSLARVQMAFWFLLVVCGFLYIYSITGEYNAVLTGQALVLIGISTFTALMAGKVDESKQGAAAPLIRAVEPAMAKIQAELEAIESRQATLNAKALAKTATGAELAALETLNADVESKRAELDALKKPVNAAASGTWSTPSKGFVQDVLTDSEGMNLHRLQLFTWTIVLGAIFVYEVWKNLTLPEFDVTLLSLMGISSGTYLGFKVPEKH